MGKKNLFTIIVFFVLILPMQAQSKDEQAVAQVVEQLRQVMIKPDHQLLENIAADKLLYIHSSGTVRDKAGFVREFIDGQSVFTSLVIFDQEIKISGKTAIVRHRLAGDTYNKKVSGTLDIIILMTWQKQGGRWKLLGRQAAKVPV